MGSNLLFRRFIQIENSLTKEDIDKHYHQNSNGLLSDGLSKIDISTSYLSIDELSKLSKNYQLVVIDTIDGIRENNQDSIAKMDNIALGLKRIAVENKNIILAIHHISKSAASVDIFGNKKPLNIHSGKGSTTIQQKADKIIGIENSEDEMFIKKVFSIAARDEENFIKYLYIDFNTFKITPTLHLTSGNLNPI